MYVGPATRCLRRLQQLSHTGGGRPELRQAREKGHSLVAQAVKVGDWPWEHGSEEKWSWGEDRRPVFCRMPRRKVAPRPDGEFRSPH